MYNKLLFTLSYYYNQNKKFVSLISKNNTLNVSKAEWIFTD